MSIIWKVRAKLLDSLQKGPQPLYGFNGYTYRNIPASPNTLPFKIGILFSALEKNLATSEYDNRVKE